MTKKALTALPSSASEARRLGELYYFNGKPCPNGHVTKRITSSYYCYDCNYASLKERNAGRYSDVGTSRTEYSRSDMRAAAAYWRKTRMWRNTPYMLEGDEIKSLYLEARGKTVETGVQHHLDHIIPLNHPLVCGLHVPWNLRVMSAKDNVVKSNSFEPYIVCKSQ